MATLITWLGGLAVLGALLIVRLFLLERPFRTLQYYFKQILFLVVLTTTTFVYIPYFCLNPCAMMNSVYVWNSMKRVSKHLGISWEVRGKKNALSAYDRECIIVANHQSSLDIVGMGVLFDTVKFVLVAKKELFYLWPIGLSGWLCGMVFIDRKNPSQANDILNKTASKIMKKEKTKMWFFPEGQRNKNNSSFLPFKKGAFRLAVSCQVPIMPIVFSPHYFLDEVEHVCETGKVIATVLPLISTEGLTMDDVDDLTENTRNLMLKTYEEMYQQILSDKALTIGYNKLAAK